MFKQDHRADFEAILQAKRPICLVRFGDGELAILQNRAHKSADAWTAGGSTWLREELYASLVAKFDGYCVGLPSPCCLSLGLQLRSLVNVPLHAQTFATLFMHVNHPKAHRLVEHFADAVVVHHCYGEIHVPPDGVTKAFDVDHVVEQLLEVKDRAVLLAAGPVSNVIAYRYWSRQEPRKRVMMLDVGSVIDVVNGDLNRHYFGKMNDHACAWYEPDRPLALTKAKIKQVGPQDEPNRLVETTKVESMGRTTYDVHGGAPTIRIGQKEVTTGLSIQKQHSTRNRPEPIRIGKVR